MTEKQTQNEQSNENWSRANRIFLPDANLSCELKLIAGKYNTHGIRLTSAKPLMQ